MPKTIDLTGQRFGRLVVRKQSGRTPAGQARWLCDCDCGERTTVASQGLRRDVSPTRSCGCMKREVIFARGRKIAQQNNVTHGQSYTSVYKRWAAMFQRCTNPNYNAGKAWKNYGGRGITVCKRWHKFENFYADMGDPPEGDYLLDRIHNNLGYWLSNCRWASRAESIANQRSHGSPPGTQGWRKRINGRFASQ